MYTKGREAFRSVTRIATFTLKLLPEKKRFLIHFVANDFNLHNVRSLRRTQYRALLCCFCRVVCCKDRERKMEEQKLSKGIFSISVLISVEILLFSRHDRSKKSEQKFRFLAFLHCELSIN